MAALTEFWDNLKERLKAALQEQQESELYISLKEKYETLTPTMQFLVKIGSAVLVAVVILWWPVSNFTDSVSQNSDFEERRQSLKDLLKIERDYAAVGAVRVPPAPFSLKAQMDQKLLGFAVKQDSIKDTVEDNGGQTAVEQKGIAYTINHVTLRQAVDIAYELEHTDTSLKLLDLELAAEPTDPHFYTYKFKIVNFSPKVIAQAAPVKAPNAK